MAFHFDHRRKYIACSSQESFAYSESLPHPTIAILVIKILIFFRALSNVHLFQRNQRFQAIEFVSDKLSKFNDSLIFPELYSQNMRGFDHERILSPSFHGVRKERLAQLPSICDPNTTKKVRGTSRKIGWGCAARFLKPLP